MSNKKNNILTGSLFAITAVIIWSGNYVVARGLSGQMAPISISFFRWLVAGIVLCPFAIKQFMSQWPYIQQHKWYLLLVALFGIAIFNTCIYIAGHYTTALNLALLGTSTSPIFSVILARIFYKEAITTQRVIGLLCCIAGILFLLSQGSLHNLLAFKFSYGDRWVLASAFAFAVYNTLVRKKPAQIAPLPFLFATILMGVLILCPFFIWQQSHAAPIVFTKSIIFTILYIGIGASVISYLCWNRAVGYLGSARASLFGYLMPIFSSVEGMLILKEQLASIHLICGLLILIGLVIANVNFKKISE
jgi:drug/metabolite transporter (DMT)-like permease